MQDKITLHVRNYRAIKSADIELADLTVLAGINSSGKSTLARMFHRLICISSNYDAYAESEVLRRFMEAVVRPLQKVFTSSVRNHVAMREMARVFFSTSRSPKSADALSAFLGKYLSSQLMVAKDVVNDSRFAEAFNAYIPATYQDVPRMKDKDGGNRWMNEVCQYFEAIYSNMVHQAAGSSSLFFDADVNGERLLDVGTGRDDALSESDGMDVAKKEFSFSNDDVPIVDAGNCVLPMGRIFSLRQSFYIARPSVDFPSVFSHRLRLNGVDYKISAKEAKSAASKVIGMGVESLIGGRIVAPKEKSYVGAADWMYSDGHNTYGLNQCAEGIKSLATLAILDTYGLLDIGSLLIIDEPEVHLHPQWVVEMAQILVRLSKERGVKVLITTHSPDLVHAIRDFSESADYASKTCFYLSCHANSGDVGYSFNRLGMDIGPIFSVFNVAKENIYKISKSIMEGRTE